MGTNYYLKAPKCPTCNHEEKLFHIGKSSGGWKFLLRAHEDPQIESWSDWIEYLACTDKEIVDEYGNKIEPLDLIELVHRKQQFKSQSSEYSEKDKYFYQDLSGFELSKNEFS